MLEFMNVISDIFFENAGSAGKYETAEPYSEYLENVNYTVDQSCFTVKPVISIIVEAGNTSPVQCVESIKNQSYNAWELIIAGESYVYSDSRIHSFADIDAAKAAEFATGDFITFISSGDILDSRALALIVKSICQNPDSDVFYTNEDRIIGNERTDPKLKPSFSPTTLLSYNYIGRLFVVSKALYSQCGGLKSFTPGGEYDFVLRACNNAIHIIHVDCILLSRQEAKMPIPVEEGTKAINKVLEKQGVDGYSVCGLWEGSFHLHCIIPRKFKCEIILYGADSAEKLRQWLELTEDVTCSSNYHITVASNCIADTKLIRYENALINNSAARVIRFPPSESFAKMCNQCAFSTCADVFIFNSCDVSPVSSDWIESLAELALMRDAGTVSPLILTPDDRIAGAGNVIGIQGWWGVPYYFEKRNFNDSRMNEFINSMRNVSLSNMDCFMVSNTIFSELNGFDTSFSGRSTILELCLSYMWKHKKNIYTPYVKMQGNPQQFTVPDDCDFERAYDVLRKCLKEGDKYYNSVYDPAFFTPKITALPYQGIKLNPMPNR